jgi:hypothetical protein
MLVRVFIFLFFFNFSSIADEFYQANQKDLRCNKELVFNPKEDIMGRKFIKSFS